MNHATDSELWKERFAFASGNILVLGLVVLQMWPWVASYQTGEHVHFWTLNTPPEGVKPQLWVFWLFVLLLATACTAVLLALVHILCRGVWLAASSDTDDDDETRGLRAALRGTADLAYRSSFVATIFLVLFSVVTPIVLLSLSVERWLVTASGLPQWIAGWVARLGLILLLLIVATPFLLRRMVRAARTGRVPFEQRTFSISMSSVLVAFGLLAALWFAAIELCYTADFVLDRQVISKKPGESLRIDLQFGGATSDPNLAALTLAHAGAPRRIEFQPLDNGRYVAIVPVDALQIGRYEITLEYPHVALGADYPYVTGVRRTRSLLVVP
jgi:hypothetical protein